MDDIQFQEHEYNHGRYLPFDVAATFDLMTLSKSLGEGT